MYIPHPDLPTDLDWRNPRDYPSPIKTSPTRWAWEFLRRNHAYRDDWATFTNICRSIVPSFDGSWKAMREHYDRFEKDKRFAVLEPPALPGESEYQWVRRVGNGTRRYLDAALGEKWGLHVLLNPMWPYDFFIFTDTPGVSGITRDTRWFLDPAKAVVRLDFNLPIKPQIRALSTWASLHQHLLKKEGVVSVPTKRKRDDHYREYLRLLDALEAGVPNAEIAAKLVPDKANNNDDRGRANSFAGWMRAAKRLRDSDYRYLVTA
jgi:hypothetical protein